MKKIFWWVLLLITVSGCASTQDIRKAQYLSDDYGAQDQKKIAVVSLIDARTDKEKDIQNLLLNRVIPRELAPRLPP